MGGVEFGFRLCKTGCGEAGKFDLKLSCPVEIIFGGLIYKVGDLDWVIGWFELVIRALW